MPSSIDEFISRVKDANIVIAGRYVFSEKTFLAAKKLEMISIWQTGYDHIDTKAATKKGVVVCNVSHYAYDSVAEMVFALILSLTRKLHLADVGLRHGNFDWRNYIGSQLMEKTLGVIGIGSIGTRVIQIAHGFNMNVIAYAHHPNDKAAKNLDVKFVDLDTLFKESDIISLHVPLTTDTERMIGMKEFSRMKKSVIFINTARGEVVDENALIKALREKQIGGAGLDVFEKEPLSLSSPLLEFDNVALTPHVAFLSHESLEECTNVCVQNVEKFIEGKPQNVVNPEVIIASSRLP
jgi:phosphoglycerate dehydrogenase-like enzyme